MSDSRLTLADAVRIGRLDAHGQAELLREGEVSVLDLVNAAALRIEAFDPAINSVTYRAFDSARERARHRHAGALAGVPYLLKDSLEYPGFPVHAGSRARTDAPATRAWPFVKRFDEEGLIPVGMSSMCEFGVMPTTEPLRYGPVHNPWDLARTTGGSSGGAAAAVAAGLVPLAHASDAGGSIRVPASCCGVVGLKPGRGANVRARAPDLGDDLLCADSLVSRSVRDVAWAFGVARGTTTRAPMAGPSSRRLRIALNLTTLEGAQPEADVAEALNETVELCARLGHHVEVTTLPIDGARVAASFRVMWSCMGTEVLETYGGRYPDTPIGDLLEPFTIALGESGRRFDGTDLERVYRCMTETDDLLVDFYRRHDVVLSPVMRERPPLLGRMAPTQPFEPLMADMSQYLGYTTLHNLTGVPAISLPLFAASDGVPIGSMFAAGRGQEEMLLALAFELEQAQPWADRWPASLSAI